MTRLWKKLPVGFRNFVHKSIHRFNSLNILLRAFGFRHYLTVRRISKAKSPRFLRLGESRHFSGWISSNYQVLTWNFIDATKDYGEELFQYIFADNVIEHLDRKGGVKLALRAFDALSPGGVLRIATPDLRSLAEKYLIGANADVQQFSKDLAQHNLDILDSTDLLRITFSAFGHHKGHIYDFESIKLLLESVGFTKVQRFAPGDSLIPELQRIESRMNLSDNWSQMAVEATKPIK